MADALTIIDIVATTTPVTDGPERWKAPFADGKYFLFEQDYIQAQANFARTAYGTAHATRSTYYLVKESDPEPLAGGYVKWTRTYSAVPDTRAIEVEKYVATFPMWGTGATYTPPSTRPALIEPVPCILQYDYFKTDTPGAVTLYSKWYPTIVSGGVTVYAGYLDTTTTPSLAAYQSDYIDKLQIDAETSEVRLWMGNIYERVRRLVFAK